MFLHSNFSMKQVYCNIKNCCVSLCRPRNQYIFVRLQINYLSIAGRTKIRNLDEIGDFGWTKNDILDNIILVFLFIAGDLFIRPLILCRFVTRKQSRRTFTFDRMFLVAHVTRDAILKSEC